MGRVLLTWDVIGQHNKPESCWIVAHGRVYNMTGFFASQSHPGGQTSLLRFAGTDASEHFDMHSKAAKALWKRLRIGFVAK